MLIEERAIMTCNIKDCANRERCCVHFSSKPYDRTLRPKLYLRSRGSYYGEPGYDWRYAINCTSYKKDGLTRTPT